MRQVLRLVGNRYGAAVTLLVVIAVVVGFGRLAGSGHPNVATGHPGAVGVNPPAAGLSSQPDDGVIQSAGPETSIVPSTSPGAAGPQTVAADFARAWLNHHGVDAATWHKGIAKYSTKTLADRLDGVDPGSVPADRTTGSATIADQGDGYAEVQVPTDQGTLVLRTVVQNGRWLVDGVDWRQS